MSLARTDVTVYALKGQEAIGQVALPDVFLAPIRPDLVNFVHFKMAMNTRQPYAVSKSSGYQTSAESWGTGRAVARIPRVGGGGTHRSGQGAFGNMCRGGGMFSPTKVYRRWFRCTNLKQRRYAVCSALAAAAVPALVMARGHRIDDVPEVPLVISDDVERIRRKVEVKKVLENLGLKEEMRRCSKGVTYRGTKGTRRNRRWVHKKGPIVVMTNPRPCEFTFRAVEGVDIADVNRLNLLELCPGGRLGRMMIFSKSAMARLADIYGKYGEAAPLKKGFFLPKAAMTNADVSRILESREVQTAIRPPKESVKYKRYAGNGLENESIRKRLNPAWNPTAVKK